MKPPRVVRPRSDEETAGTGTDDSGVLSLVLVRLELQLTRPQGTRVGCKLFV